MPAEIVKPKTPAEQKAVTLPDKGAMIAQLFLLSLMKRKTVREDARKSPNIKKSTKDLLLKNVNNGPKNENSIRCTAMCTWGHGFECRNGDHTDGIHYCPGAGGHNF